MAHLYSNYSSCWHSSEHQVSSSLTKSLSLNEDSPTELRLNAKSMGFQLLDPDSSSSQSTQSNHGLTATPRSMSLEPGQEVNGGNNPGKRKPLYSRGHPETDWNNAHIDYSRTMTCMPYPCGDPYFNGLLSAYGPTPVIQTKLFGITSARIPLPADISEDEPIYVNAKQYHGILRRRQSRAKLEAQNKLIRARKPYLHESRHRHALNRVRGTGGRFLSNKKLQQSDSSSTHNHSHSSSNPSGHSNVNTLGFNPVHQSAYMETQTSSSSAFYEQNDGFMNCSNQYHAPVVR